MKFFSRIISSFLVLAIVISLCPVSFAADSGVGAKDVIADTSSVTAWNNYLSGKGIGSASISSYWSKYDAVFARVGYGSLSSLALLEQKVNQLHVSSRGLLNQLIEVIVDSLTNLLCGSDIVVMYDSSMGLYRPYHVESGLWMVNSKGYFPYYKDDSTSSGSINTAGGGRWIAIPSCNFNGKVILLTENVLSDLCLSLNEMGQGCSLYAVSDQYYVISKGNYCYANLDDLPYVARIDEESHAVNNSNNYYTNNEGDNIFNEGDTVNNTLIDNSSSTVWFPDGTLNYIDQLIYDGSTKTYYVDAHEEYNTENNTYVSNTYLYQYHIDYTSITYIGQTEEFEETYKYYYELPDGRSSADLTKEDLEQLSLSFKDVVNYARSADDLTQRVLFHFDGNTTDSSYWSYCTDFYWDYGASLTYMDEGVFGGSLYLDETTHKFTVRLPSVGDVSGDFTLQFRYYQSHTEAPQADSYIKIGDTTFLTFTGAVYQDKNGTGLCSTQVGSWNEICIMRKDGVVYYYINGVCEGTVADSQHYTNSIQFYFGPMQQTYKKLDELRFSRAAVYSAGENYTVSAVPFDSNLTLVLPDGEFPLADETVKLVPAEDNLFTEYGLDDWTSTIVRDALEAYSEPLESYYSGTLYYNPSYVSFKDNTASLGVTVSGSSESSVYSTDFASVRGGFFLPVKYDFYTYYPEDDDEDSVIYSVPGFEDDTDYTLTVYLEDGSYSYVVFHVGDSDSAFVNIVSVCDFAGIDFREKPNTYEESDDSIDLYRCTNGILICPPLNTEINIVYMELVEGNSPHFTMEYEYAVYSSGQLTESPVLAVRSALDVTSYQFGGVRPSYPEIGQVWALVENGRISSLQQYTGYAWESVDGRIWTGQRWVPYYAFDVLLLKDMYDIIEADPSQDFIYTQEGFWSWLQKAWAQMMDKLDQIIDGLGGKKPGGTSETCDHVYGSKVDREPGCVEPGHMVYTCEKCGHVYTEIIDATGHDWVVTEHVGLGAGEYAFVDTIEQCVDPAVRYVLPDGYVYVYVVDETAEDPQTGQWLNSGVVYDEDDKGYDLLTCTKCGAESKDYGDGPEESDLFDALGDFLAEGIEWLLALLTDLVDSLSGIVDTFRGYIEKVGALAGPFPAFFGAFMAIVPEDLRLLLWFALVGFVALTIWRKVTK